MVGPQMQRQAVDFAWRESDVAPSETVRDRKDLQSFSMHLGTPITPVTRRSVSGSVTMFLNPSQQTKSTDDCAVGRIDQN